MSEINATQGTSSTAQTSEDASHIATDRATLAADAKNANAQQAERVGKRVGDGDGLDVASRTQKDTPDAKLKRNKGKYATT